MLEDLDAIAWGELTSVAGKATGVVREAVAAQLEPLTELLDDRDPHVRAGATYAASRVGVSAERLWDCWSDEDDPGVMAELALALGELDPGGAGAELELAALNGPPQVRIAAAMALLRAGLDWPAGTEAALVTAIDEGADFPSAGDRRTNWRQEITLALPEQSTIALIELMLRSERRTTREIGIRTIRRFAGRPDTAEALPQEPIGSIRHIARLLDNDYWRYELLREGLDNTITHLKGLTPRG